MTGSSTPLFYEKTVTDETLWRSIILFGRNVATYKFALGKALLDLAREDKTLISLDELAEPYSRYLCEHLKLTEKQGTFQKSRFLHACRQYNEGSLPRERLIEKTVELGFNNVIDAFHIVGSAEVERRFFMDERKAKKGIEITDRLLELKDKLQFLNLPYEVEARWRLVETAWSLNISPNLLEAKHDDESQLIFIENRDRKRVSVASSRDSLNGYQKGKCFFCFKDIIIDDTNTYHLADVDHFFPHSLNTRTTDHAFNINGIWNLVLACRECNRGAKGKFDLVPSLPLLERLHRRNEWFIESHHPLRETIIKQTGSTPEARVGFLQIVHNVAHDFKIHTWTPSATYEPAF
jgi:hypothetical protein